MALVEVGLEDFAFLANKKSIYKPGDGLPWLALAVLYHRSQVKVY